MLICDKSARNRNSHVRLRTTLHLPVQPGGQAQPFFILAMHLFHSIVVF